MSKTEANKILYNLKFKSPIYSKYDVRTEEFDSKVENLSYTQRPIYNNGARIEPDGDKIALYSEDYYVVCYNYILTAASDAQGTIDMELDFYHPEISDYNIKVASNSIPVRQNYKTNIFGNFLTNGEIFGVTIDRNFDNIDIPKHLSNE